VFVAVVGQMIGGPAAFSYPAKAAPAGSTGQYIGSAHAMFQLGFVLGPTLGILLFDGIGKWFWGVCVLLGLAMVGPGIWGLRPSVPAGESAGASAGESAAEPAGTTETPTTAASTG
jgi:hypothetical protein